MLTVFKYPFIRAEIGIIYMNKIVIVSKVNKIRRIRTKNTVICHNLTPLPGLGRRSRSESALFVKAGVGRRSRSFENLRSRNREELFRLLNNHKFRFFFKINFEEV